MARELLSDHEWLTLQFAPFWAFQGVAGMDSGIDEPERQSFFNYVRNASSPPGLAREVMTSVAADLDGLSKRWNEDPRSAPDGLDETARILAKLPHADARGFAAVLMVIGLNAARASGGGGFLARGPIGASERLGLGGMAGRFGLSAEEAEAMLSEQATTKPAS